MHQMFLPKVHVPACLEEDLLGEAAAVREAASMAAAEHGGGRSGGGSKGSGGVCMEGGAREQSSPDLLQERRWLLLGPAGAGSRWHVDPHAT